MYYVSNYNSKSSYVLFENQNEFYKNLQLQISINFWNITEFSLMVILIILTF